MAKTVTRAVALRGHGFTLVEALVVVAILAIVLGLAVPSLTGLRERQQLQAQAEDFWSSLMLARSQALLHQQHVTVCTASNEFCDPSAAWDKGWLVFVDANRNGRREGNERLLLQRNGTPAGVHITGNSTVSHAVGYGAEGRSESLSGGFQAGTVTACAVAQNTGWQVVINAVGRPRLEKTDTPSCP